ncbi:PAS domain-containing protein [bacterium]|nr:PAS domain-containing protein [bacterium]
MSIDEHMGGSPARAAPGGDTVAGIAGGLQLLERALKSVTWGTVFSPRVGSWSYDPGKDEVILSDETCEILGITGGEAAYDLARVLALVHAADRGRVASSLESVIVGRSESVIAEFRLKIDGPGEKTIRAVAERVVTPEADTTLVVGMMMDVTAHWRQERQLARDRGLFLGGPTIFFRWRADDYWTVDYVSANVGAYLGWTRDQMLVPGFRYGDIVHPEDIDALVDRVDEALAAGDDHLELEYRIVRPDGEAIWVHESTVALRDEKGEPAGFHGYVHDVTGRKLNELDLERRVAERTAELAEATKRARSADDLKTRFLATFSHELRTPLHAIMGFTDIMLSGLSGEINDETREHLGYVKESALQLRQLIDDTLDLSSIEAGTLKIVNTIFDMREVVERALRGVQSDLRRKGLASRCTIADDVREMFGAPLRLEQILRNLLDNAVKFTDEGVVAVDCRFENGRLRLSVSDTGPGIPPEELAAIFEDFRQSNVMPDRTRRGVGLGLAICRRLGGLMGGEIEVASELGRGSVFTYSQPLIVPF